MALKVGCARVLFGIAAMRMWCARIFWPRRGTIVADDAGQFAPRHRVAVRVDLDRLERLYAARHRDRCTCAYCGEPFKRKDNHLYAWRSNAELAKSGEGLAPGKAGKAPDV